MSMHLSVLLLVTIISAATVSARPTFDVVAKVLHEMVDEALTPDYQQRPYHGQRYPCPAGGCYNGRNPYPQGAYQGTYPHHYNSVNRPADYGHGYPVYGAAQGPYSQNSGFAGQDNYLGTGYQSPPIAGGPNVYDSRGYGRQQISYPYSPHSHSTHTGY